MRFYVPRPVLVLRLVSFFVVPLTLLWAVLLHDGFSVSALVAGLIFSLPALVYVVLALRFSVSIDGDRLVVRALGRHTILMSDIRAVTKRQRGFRLLVLVDTVQHGWITLPAPVGLSFLQKERYEAQYQAMLDWWEASRQHEG